MRSDLSNSWSNNSARRSSVRRERRLLLVDEERAVAREAAHHQRLPQTQQIHFGDERLADDLADVLQEAVVQRELLIGRRDAEVLVGARRDLQFDRLTRAAEQYGP